MVKMVLGSSDSQATSVATLADNYTAGFESLISAFDSLANEDKLSGDAYTNIKSYGSSVVAPLVKAFILLADAAKADVQKLPDEYRAQVGGEDLDEETLTAQISAYATTIEANQTSVTSLGKTEPMTDAVQANINSLNDAITSDTAAKTELEEKLRKLREYDAQSSGFFSDIAALESAVTTGISQLQAGVTSFNGTFTLPSQKELEWTKTVNSQWEEREAYLEAVEKGKKGEELNDEDVKAIEAYQKRHPNVKIDEALNKALDNYAESKKLLIKAEEAHKKGEIDDKTYQSIKSGLINFGAAYVKELIQSKVTDKAVEAFTKQAISWLSNNIDAMQLNVAGALANGGITTFGIDYNPVYANFIRGSIKYGIPVVGALVDFGMQKASGESTGDALIKTGAHVAIGLKAAAIGTAIGGPFGTVVGFGIGVLGSMAFDYVYDNKEQIVDGIADTAKKATKAVGETVDKVGDAISGFGKTLGSVFG
ncbi:T7SS effector LXG polymorphic toxin [Streptococcus ferus]|uniref:T7SS effector LXG polymorphic toxin n=1 Tax=Streptococcus ferus TaxID=1345 RepID=UPI0023531039|nr:T7SS effector LXG polymorphic toxin [Streptococcus ferus]